jgi:hypothetical protein
MDKSDAKKTLRQALIEQRLNLPDRLDRAETLQRVMRIWLVGRPDTVIGAYWPIKGEFDPLPALHRWKEDGELLDEPALRRIGLPVVNKQHKTLTFHAWYPGCPMEEDAYGIPKPKDTEVIVPSCCLFPAWATALAATGWATAAASTTARWLHCNPGRSRWGWATRRVTWTISSPKRTTSRWTRSSMTTAWSGRYDSGVTGV